MAEPALLPAAQMERLAPVSLASPCPRIPRAHIARRPGRRAQRRTELGCSSGPSSGPGSQLPQRNPLRARPADGSHSPVSSAQSLSLDGFWMEVEQIQQRDELREEDGSGGEGRPPEEGEAESQWLQDTGLSDLLGGLGLDSHHRGLLSTLTPTQVAAVRRRLAIYARSARRRHKAPVRDVRDIFGGFNAGEMPSENGHSGMKWTQLSSGSPKSPPAAEPEGPQAQAGVEQAFHMDSAYSEQAALLLQRGRQPPGGTGVWSKGSLPKFRVPKGRLGLTRIGDLSSQDLKKMAALALIELTALCDVLGVELKRSKAGKPKAAETGLFGVPLEALLEADCKALPGTQVPLLLQALLSCLEKRGLNMEGILRVPGSQARVKGLEQKLERDFHAGLFSWDEVHLNDASDLLKRFIRELPAPLLTAEYLPAFAVVPNIPDLRQRLQALHLLILILPEPNRNTLKALLEFLRKVVAQEQSNKMTLWNVSTVMAPNLFLHRGQPPKLLKGREKQLAEAAAEVVQMMVHYQDLLWVVSSFLVAQVRNLNDSSSRRPQLCDAGLKTWLRRTHADRDKEGDGPEAAPAVAKIQVAWLTKDTLEVALTPSTRVAHVLGQFTGRLSPGSQGPEGNEDKDGLLPRSRLRKKPADLDIILCEVGGNLTEHRLDPDAYLLDLYRANPCGEWVLKQSPT
ncbi:rho GTPase-activating protein 40 isoform X1 [Pipistrellus kuhlii]|uniref:Rho GTPase activating protein 40 n=1 Tax=Pipistrellus kuhlii TaxID=59472 RepID=A0A7J7Y8N5_PIPKU|nr:rho GTPase-activating protein 40 isoform X1 [Pipistrellus kuhlii]KAF6357860.1 Rho GTPase activating protein 40 [Pipistrellus kuhlii]